MEVTACHYSTIENYINYNNVQQSYPKPKLTDLGQNTHFPGLLDFTYST
jgi:hypothetical protein